jgi:serine/threonine protein kinase
LTLASSESDNRRVSGAAAEVGSTANSYQILAKLATGGMAEIFLARGQGVAGVERHCVLKRILRDRASDVTLVRMFLDEARLAAQLQHPNIAQVYDIGKLGDSYFFTMEYVHGETVRALLHRAQSAQRALPIGCVLTIVAGAAAGLHHAHDRVGAGGRALGIVHRDVSPSNLMVSYEGGVKLVDFGVAKAADRAQETRSGTVKGKISYLSPEQCKGKRVDRRSDLFSLGICFWEMLTTERLYKRDSDFENMNAIVTEPTPPPSSRRPELPREIDALVGKLLAKSPDHRFQTADELIEAIEAVAARTGSVLSSAALGRLIRELFGRRPEPWLEIDRHPDPAGPVTVTGEPIPDELIIAIGELDHPLSNVVDLSPPRAVTESLDALAADNPTTRIGKLTPAGQIYPLGGRAVRGSVPPPLPGAGAPALPARSTTEILDSPVPPDGDAGTLPSGDVVLVAPEPLRRTLTLSAVSPGLVAAPVGPRVTPASGLDAALAPRVQLSNRLDAAAALDPAPDPRTGSPRDALEPRDAVSARTPRRARSAGTARAPSGRARRWAVYAAIAGAALIGSIAVMLERATDPSAVSSAAGAPATARPFPSAERAAPTGPAPPTGSAPATGGTPPPGLAPSAAGSADSTAAAADRAPRRVDDAVGAGDRASGSRPASAATPTSASGVTIAVKPVSRRSTAHPAAGPRASAAASSGSGDGMRDASDPRVAARTRDDELQRAFNDTRYSDAVALCHAPISAERATLCVVAACEIRNQAKARALLSAVAPASREPLIERCQQLGVELKPPSKPPGAPAADCEADPMACQR